MYNWGTKYVSYWNAWMRLCDWCQIPHWYNASLQLLPILTSISCLYHPRLILNMRNNTSDWAVAKNCDMFRQYDINIPTLHNNVMYWHQCNCVCWCLKDCIKDIYHDTLQRGVLMFNHVVLQLCKKNNALPILVNLSHSKVIKFINIFDVGTGPTP